MPGLLYFHSMAKKPSRKGVGGRPTKYQEAYVRQAYVACARMGATDIQLAELFGVDEKTINTWKEKHQEFLQSLKDGKDEYDSGLVEASLRERAVGYQCKETVLFQNKGRVTDRRDVIKQYPPDTTAAIFWLKNRQPERWRDKQDHELSGPNGGPIETKDVDSTKIAQRLVYLLNAATNAPEGDS